MPRSQPESSAGNGRRPVGRRLPLALACLVAVSASLLLAACGGSSSSSDTGGSTSAGGDDAASTPSGEPQAGGTLNVVTPLPIESLEQHSLPPTAGTVLTFVYDGLVEPKPGTTELQPALAESWDVSADGREYTFKLRPGVKFSNGNPLTTDDVVYSLEAWKEFMLEQSPSCCENITDISAPTKDSVLIKYSKPHANLLQDLAWDYAGIMDKDVREEIGPEAYARKPIGTGPFKVASFRTGDAKLVRNDLYWQEGKPYLDEVTVKSVSDANTRILSVKSGEAQIATGIPYGQAKALESDPSGNLLIEDPWAAVYTVFINASEPPLSETEVRRALSYASDRETILANALSGLGSIANSAAVPFGSYDESVEQLPYDLDLAQEELAKSSVPDGFPLEILVQSGDTNGDVTAAIMQDSLGQIGIESSIRKVDPGTYISEFIAGKYDLAVGPYDWWPALVPDVEPQFIALFNSPGSNNTFTWYENPGGTKLVKELSVATDEAERNELASEVQKITVEDPPILAMAFLTNVTLTGTNVCNYYMRPVSRVLGNSADVYLGDC